MESEVAVYVYVYMWSAANEDSPHDEGVRHLDERLDQRRHALGKLTIPWHGKESNNSGGC